MNPGFLSEQCHNCKRSHLSQLCDGDVILTSQSQKVRHVALPCSPACLCRVSRSVGLLVNVPHKASWWYWHLFSQFLREFKWMLLCFCLLFRRTSIWAGNCSASGHTAVGFTGLASHVLYPFWPRCPRSTQPVTVNQLSMRGAAVSLLCHILQISCMSWLQWNHHLVPVS